MYLQHPDLAIQHAQQRSSSPLERSSMTSWPAGPAPASAARRQRRRLTLTARAQPRQPVHEQAGTAGHRWLAAEGELMVKRSIAPDSRDVARLRRGFQGQILLPEEGAYHQARSGMRWWIGGRHHHPLRQPRRRGRRGWLVSARGTWRSGCDAAATASLACRCPRPD